MAGRSTTLIASGAKIKIVTNKALESSASKIALEKLAISWLQAGKMKISALVLP